MRPEYQSLYGHKIRRYLECATMTEFCPILSGRRFAVLNRHRGHSWSRMAIINRCAHLALISIGGETLCGSARTASGELVLSDSSGGTGGFERVGGGKLG